MPPSRRTRDAPYVPPMNRLPTELLCHIFHLLNHIERKEGTTLGSMTQRSIIQSTCTHWREILLNTPDLWSSICVDPNSIKYRVNAHLDGVLDTLPVKTCIRRSRQQPLDIFIYARPPQAESYEYEIPSFTSGHMNTALSLLIPHLSRWRSLVIQTIHYSVMHDALQQIEPHITTMGAPLLESMTLVLFNPLSGYRSEFEPERRYPAFLSTYNNTIVRAHLPRLKELTLTGVHVDWSSLASMLSRSQSPLKKLDLMGHYLDMRPSLSEFRDLLMATPHLTKLVLMTGPHVPQPSLESLVNVDCPILLQHLEEFTIGDHTSFDGQVLLKCFAAPNVKVLTVNNLVKFAIPMGDPGWLMIHIGAGHEWFISNIDSLHHGNVRDTWNGAGPVFRPLFPLLEEVTLLGVSTDHTSESLQTFFRGVPNVRKLELQRCCTRVFEALKPFREGGVPLPQLQLLIIRRRNVELDYETLDFAKEIAEERARAGCRLPAVRIIGGARRMGTQVYRGRCGTDIVAVYDEEGEDVEERARSHLLRKRCLTPLRKYIDVVHSDVI